MAVPSCAKVFPAFECRSDTEFSGSFRAEYPRCARRHSPPIGKSLAVPFGGLSSLIFKFPPNFERQLSTKARRNCSNIGVAQVVAASWSTDPARAVPAFAASAAGAPSADIPVDVEQSTVVNGGHASNINDVQFSDLFDSEAASFLRSDGSIAIHAGERSGRGIVTDAITTPVVNTSAYFFKKTSELIDYKEGRHASFEYGRYGNPTTVVLEEKISALEGAESTLVMASGMCASTVMLMALVPAGGHIVTTTDCYRKTRIFIETILPKMGIKPTVIDPADMDALKSALDNNDVTLFFTESPTNPFLRCVDVELVSKVCHSKGALVCIDGTFATPLNQKVLALGADIVLHSATKYIAGHNDVLAGYISGSEKLVSQVRTLHNILGGVLNPNAAYLIIRGMKTLHLRVQQQNTTALRMARLLEGHPKVSCVYYPGLVSHPEHSIAKKQMTGFGGVVSFEVDGDLMTTAKFIDALRIPYIAPSFGGCESIVDQPAIMTYWDLSQIERAKYGIKDNLVRFSFGVEDFEDLKADILQALAII
ncbi:Cystathionine gamma-synthase [Bertholletia excelsa]